MTMNFHGGPANRVCLGLRRAPAILRVVVNPQTKDIDALDQLSDSPEAGETIHVYKLRDGKAGRVHLCYRGRNRSQSGWYATGDYDFVETPPDDKVRDPARWAEYAAQMFAAHFPNSEISS